MLRAPSPTRPRPAHTRKLLIQQGNALARRRLRLRLQIRVNIREVLVRNYFCRIRRHLSRKDAARSSSFPQAKSPGARCAPRPSEVDPCPTVPWHSKQPSAMNSFLPFSALPSAPVSDFSADRPSPRHPNFAPLSFPAALTAHSCREGECQKHRHFFHRVHHVRHFHRSVQRPLPRLRGHIDQRRLSVLHHFHRALQRRPQILRIGDRPLRVPSHALRHFGVVDERILQRGADARRASRRDCAGWPCAGCASLPGDTRGCCASPKAAGSDDAPRSTARPARTSGRRRSGCSPKIARTSCSPAPRPPTPAIRSPRPPRPRRQ